MDLYIIDEFFELYMSGKKFSNLQIICRNSGSELPYIDVGKQQIKISLSPINNYPPIGDNGDTYYHVKLDISYNSLGNHTRIISIRRFKNFNFSGHETNYVIGQPIQPEFSINLVKGLKIRDNSITCICKFNYIKKGKEKKVDEVFTNDSNYKQRKGYKTLHTDKDHVENKFFTIISSNLYNERVLDKIKDNNF